MAIGKYFINTASDEVHRYGLQRYHGAAWPKSRRFCEDLGEFEDIEKAVAFAKKCRSYDCANECIICATHEPTVRGIVKHVLGYSLG